MLKLDNSYKNQDFTTIDLKKIRFIDIETVPMVAEFKELPEVFQHLWDKKTLNQRGEISAEEYFNDKGGIMAEFGKIICISIGSIEYKNENELQLKLHSLHGNDEEKILAQFGEILQKRWDDGKITHLCAHNGKEFDIPYICRKMIINNIPLPIPLQLHGKKPWDTPHLLDTMELWKFGDNKNYTSLELLTAVFNIPTPKDDMDGSQVTSVYYQDKDIERIASYCEKDVIATAQVFLAMRGKGEHIAKENISTSLK
jgi:predicted PolB exonuclease-like 3'-5' exonuclease